MNGTEEDRQTLLVETDDDSSCGKFVWVVVMLGFTSEEDKTKILKLSLAWSIYTCNDIKKYFIYTQ